MSAIITSQFRKNNVAKILSELSGSTNRYYIGIGRADPWPNENDTEASVPTPDTSASAVLDAKSSLIGMKIIDSSSANYMVPNVSINSNRKYKAYDSTDETCFYPTLSGAATTNYPCYAIYNDKVFLCIYNGDDGDGTIATFSGSALTAHGSIANVYVDATGDSGNYHWVYVSNIKTTSTLDVAEFVEIDSSESDYSPAVGSLDGQVWKARIVDDGSNYSPANSNGTYSFTSAVEGDGSSLAGNVVVSGGAITEVTISNHGTGYTKAKINLSLVGGGLSGEIALSVLPENGVGFDPYETLPTWYLGVAAKFSDTESGEIPVDLSYRQISIIKDPTITPTDGYISSQDSPADSPPDTPEVNAADALKWIEIDSGTLAAYSGGAGEAQLTSDINSNSLVVIEDANGSKGFAVRYDDSDNRIYYYQNNSDTVNQTPFAGGSPSISLTVDVGADGSSVGGITYNNIGDGEYDGTSGDLIFLENRNAIARADSQVEDIRVIIQF